MIVLWCESDFDKTIEVKDWLDEHISYIEHRRDSIPSHVKTIVRAYGNTYTGKLSYTPVYNHYVRYTPYYTVFSSAVFPFTQLLGPV